VPPGFQKLLYLICKTRLSDVFDEVNQIFSCISLFSIVNNLIAAWKKGIIRSPLLKTGYDGNKMNYDKALIAGKLRRWEKYIMSYKLPDWDVIPDIGLYMEQVLALLEE